MAEHAPLPYVRRRGKKVFFIHQTEISDRKSSYISIMLDVEKRPQKVKVLVLRLNRGC